MKLHAIDVFAGCGGLTVGLKRAGIAVRAAIELEKHAAASYRANHSDVHVFEQDIRNLSGDAILRKIGIDRLDMIAGCPPCQGFSSLTRSSSAPDPRNELVFEIARLTRELRPDLVMMENVPGLAMKGEAHFNKLLRSLRAMSYRLAWGVLQVADYGVPQRRRRLVLFASRKFQPSLPAPTHSRGGKNGLPKWRSLRDLSGQMSTLGTPNTLSAALAAGGPSNTDWHVVRDISSANKTRLRHAKPGGRWSKIPKRSRPECHQDLSSGFQNVYGRMTWDEPAPTITGGCTTPSKGRFGHPDQLRTISVREAALIQTFPVDYQFVTNYMEFACTMIGNALPCDFAEHLATSLLQQHVANS